MGTGLSFAARAAIAAAWSGIDTTRLLDHHTHMIGLGSGGDGCFVNPIMKSWLHPFRHAEFLVIRSASALEHDERADREYIERIVAQVRAIPGHGRHAFLALDAFHHEDGRRDEDLSTFIVPNDVVIAAAKEFPDVFVPVASIHPYRKDAVAELERCADQGCRMVKWLPNAMGIDPMSPLCGPFYDAMKKRGMVLLSHAGEEKAVVASMQELGDPLRLRSPLDHGVRVIVAHSAGLGEDEDLDAPDKPLVSSFELFLRLMDDKKYDGLVFGELSATTLRNRITTGVMERLLARTDLHERLVNGSDYPLPAASVLLKTELLVERGLLTETDVAVLHEIGDYDPLLLDFMIKRMLSKDGRRFPASVFEDRLGILPHPR